MELKLDATELTPLVRQIVAEVVGQLATAPQSDGRMAFLESEAAALLGVRRTVLRDARLRGEIESCLAGRRVAYTREQLMDYLTRDKQNAR